MKVIVVKKGSVGNVGDILDVKSGYGQYLISQNIVARDDLKLRQKIQTEAEKKNKLKKAKNMELDNALNRIKKNSILNMHMKANKQGHLYAAISNEDIIKALESQLSIIKGNLDIKLLTTLKQLGKFEVEISINNIIKRINIHVKHIKQLNDNKAN